MTDSDEGRELTDHERAMILPQIQEVQNLRRSLQTAERQLFGLLALAEPAMLDKSSGMTFDSQALRFERTAANTEG